MSKNNAVAEVMTGRELAHANGESTADLFIRQAAVDAYAAYQAGDENVAVRVAPGGKWAKGARVTGTVVGAYQQEHAEYGAYGVCVYKVELSDGELGLFAVHAIPEVVRGFYRRNGVNLGDRHTFVYRGERESNTGRTYHDYVFVDDNAPVFDPPATW